jgi:hypothetical protein
MLLLKLIKEFGKSSLLRNDRFFYGQETRRFNHRFIRHSRDSNIFDGMSDSIALSQTHDDT